ncbi:outer membrane pore protein E [Klebsiella aerogenes]|nr:outer membrane pore protein E [Klebsiella aerogenes]
MFPEFGGDSSAQTDNFMTKRASGLATYRNTDFFGLVGWPGSDPAVPG